MQKRKFIKFGQRRSLTLTYNKSKHLLFYCGKWIKPEEFYRKGYEDANVSEKCARCDKPTDIYNWRCDECQKKHRVEMVEIINEVAKVL